MTQKTHTELSDVAIGWLYGIGCSIFAKEVPTGNGIADALGIRTRDEKQTVYYLEAKKSRSDLICSKQKAVYLNSRGGGETKCYLHLFKMQGEFVRADSDKCKDCKQLKENVWDTGIDFYYFILADGVKISASEYPLWGVINQNGKVIRKAKRMKREKDTKQLIESIAHVLVYKVFGKLYLPQ